MLILTLIKLNSADCKKFSEYEWPNLKIVKLSTNLKRIDHTFLGS